MKGHGFFRVHTVAVLLSLALPTLSAAQVAVPLPASSELKGNDWQKRREAFGKLIGAADYAEKGVTYMAPLLKQTLASSDAETRNARKSGLIVLLETENRVVATESTLTDEYLNYYGDVIAAVSNLNEPRSLNALVGAITTGGMAMRALISLGAPAVDAVIGLLDNPQSRIRISATRVLSQMLESSKAISENPALREKIAKGLQKAATDDYFAVRLESINGLVRLGDRKSLGLVQQMVKRDPFRGDAIPGYENRYPVREAAARALAPK